MNSFSTFFSTLVFLLALGLACLANTLLFKLHVLFYLVVLTSCGPQLPLALFFLPYVMASTHSTPFPNIGFKEFSDLILGNFGPTISLPTVLVLLFSVTNNTELLSLHFKQAKKNEATSWIRCLARAIKQQLGPDSTNTLFSSSELSLFETTITRDPDIASLAGKLGHFSETLKVYPYNQKQKFTGTLKPISHESIQPALLICPNSSVCLTLGCNQSPLQQNTRPRDIPRVTLIKGTNIHQNVQLLSGWCKKCETIYYADHERTPASENAEAMKFFLNSAHYLKVGRKLWVNREFSTAVLNAMYDLHASASGWMNFFNDTYGNKGLKLSHRHIWAAFVQESI
jgi:energy-coupling factor transporter transmembrane protein EcfT